MKMMVDPDAADKYGGISGERSSSKMRTTTESDEDLS